MSDKYINKNKRKKRISNSKVFCGIKTISSDGILYLKNNEYGMLLEINPLDLSLSSSLEKESFFIKFKSLFYINNIKLKCIKIDKKMNLNNNKENYSRLLVNCNNIKRKELLEKHFQFIDYLEKESLTYSSAYYFVVIADNIELLKKQLQEINNIFTNLNPKIYFEVIKNKLEIYQFLNEYYFENNTISQTVSLDLIDLLAPLSAREYANFIKKDNKQIQLITIKNIPTFVPELFFEQIFNIPKVNACINITTSIDSEALIRNIDENYKFLISDRNSTSKLSEATELDTLKESFKVLMNDLKNGNEKILEIELILAIQGSKEERENIYREIVRIATNNYIKVDIPRLRQVELWQAYDFISCNSKDYINYLPTMTLSASFPLTKSYFNDATGYFLGVDIYTDLPIFFNPFFLNKKTRNSHNIAIVASTGGGKSFTIKKILINEFARGTKIFILDAEGEYKKMIKENGGEYIDLYSRKQGIINPLQIRYIPTEETEKQEFKTYDAPLAKHMSFLEEFFKSTFEEITEKEMVTLLDIVEKLYSNYGIDSNTSIEELEKFKNTDYPTFSDLNNYISKYKEQTVNREKIEIVNQLEILLSRFLTGTDAYLFNDYTNIDLSNDLIAFGLKDLLFGENKRLKNTQILNLLTYLNNAVVSNKIYNDKLSQQNKKTICIIADEFHLFIDDDNGGVLKNIAQLARRIRKYNGSLIVASQSIEDFVGNDQVLRHAKAIFNNCQYQLTGILNEADMNAYLELFKENPLTDTQKAFLLKANQGDFLMNVTRRKRLRVHIEALPFELEFMGE